MTLLARLLGLLRRGGTRSQTTPRFHAALRKHLACFESHPMYATWWEYASSTVQRGEQTVAILERFAPMKGCCCLDIGTAYGGFPIACRKAGATEAIGLEIDADVLVVARELAADLRCQIEYRAGDATDAHTVAALGTFDRITCNDVIEHVDNPSRLADHLSMLLRPGGLLLLEAPNMFCLDAVLRDGHYGLFGLTLIPREPAKRYYHQVFTDPYRVGDYLMLSEYLTMFAKRGLDAYHLNWTEANEEDLRKLSERMDELERTASEKVAAMGADEQSNNEVREALTSYLAGYKKIEDRRLTETNPAERVRLGREVTLTYLSYMWQMIARRGTVAIEPANWVDRDEAAARSRFQTR